MVGFLYEVCSGVEVSKVPLFASFQESSLLHMHKVEACPKILMTFLCRGDLLVQVDYRPLWSFVSWLL